ncbi:hypothetical protein CKAH01_12254 [Colletotrichum kahawae]|uniref:Uncharacterized protein n=1 Tax=Colletotrichum kahawae TaxID=34407 RepID=A0AAE0DD21_COLKA|nr:hypothetical protein CKAH01_12254 [Colletotrichum kahawae]
MHSCTAKMSGRDLRQITHQQIILATNKVPRDRQNGFSLQAIFILLHLLKVVMRLAEVFMDDDFQKAAGNEDVEALGSTLRPNYVLVAEKWTQDRKLLRYSTYLRCRKSLIVNRQVHLRISVFVHDLHTLVQESTCQGNEGEWGHASDRAEWTDTV